MRWSRRAHGEEAVGSQPSEGSGGESAQAVALSEAAPKSMDATRTEVLAATVLTAFVLLVGLFPFPLPAGYQRGSGRRCWRGSG